MGSHGRVFVHGRTSQTYGLGQYRRMPATRHAVTNGDTLYVHLGCDHLRYFENAPEYDAEHGAAAP